MTRHMGKIKILDLKKITKDDVLKFVQYERDLRYSDRYQNLYQERIVNGKRTGSPVEDDIQNEVLLHFGYDLTEENLFALRTTFSLYRNDEDVRNIAFWIGLNIMHDGVNIGSEIKNFKLYDLNTKQVMLNDIINKKTIIMAGSIT